MPEARLMKHIQTDRREKATAMWIRWKDVDMTERCGEMESSLY